MNVLLAHNYYQQSGGEDGVLELEKALMKAYDNDVELFMADNSQINSFMGKVKCAILSSYSSEYKKKVGKVIDKINPNVLHCHNIFPLLTPAIYDSCTNYDIATVQTLHNYRVICPGALLMRDRIVCEKCVTGSPYHAVLHSCYKNSMVGTFAVSRMVDFHRRKGTWKTKVNRFIALTQFAKEKFVEAGFPAHKISVKPNFIDDPISESEVFYREDRALFVGRMSQEKGVDVMLSAWHRVNYPLAIAGDGPTLATLKNEIKNNNICFLGNQSKAQIHSLMSTVRFLVMPSVWYEGFPMVLVEAFAHGLPVICSRLGGMAEIVGDGVTGLHFEAGNADDLAKKVRWMINHPEECEQLGKNARFEYEQKYTPDKNYGMLMDIYQQAINDAKNSS